MNRGRRFLILLLTLLVLAGAAAGLLAYRSLVTDLAASAGRDLIVQTVNAIVKELMRTGAGEGLVTLERGPDGSVKAVTTNVPAVNALAAEVLDRAVAATEERDLTVNVPLGNLFGRPLFRVPTAVKLLSSSTAGFRSELDGAGINQTRHRILLTVRVEALLLMPWRVVSAGADTEILVSETVIVGEVPRSLMDWSLNQ